jgi:hypothetical protein
MPPTAHPPNPASSHNSAATSAQPCACLDGSGASTVAAERPPPWVHPPDGAPEQEEAPAEEPRPGILETRRQQLERLEARVDTSSPPRSATSGSTVQPAAAQVHAKATPWHGPRGDAA